MVTTRSKGAQTQLDDFADANGTITKGREKATPKKTTAKIDTKEKNATPSKKRKSPHTSASKEPAGKRTKTNAPTKQSAAVKSDEPEPTVTINRAPVLQLWGASVTHFIYPDLNWETCLSAGSAISTICAVAKGRSIGTVAERDDDDDEKKHKRDEAKKKQKDLDVIEVMHFKLKLNDGLALVGSEQKGKPGNEEQLKKKFGDDEYKAAKTVFEEVLKGWKGDEDELNKQAFGFYEKFRPEVRAGQKGWGSKGKLGFEKVRNTVLP